jgi:hypothetical protein
VDARDIQAVDDICDRLANGRPPVDGEYAEMTGDDTMPLS